MPREITQEKQKFVYDFKIVKSLLQTTYNPIIYIIKNETNAITNNLNSISCIKTDDNEFGLIIPNNRKYTTFYSTAHMRFGGITFFDLI